LKFILEELKKVTNLIAKIQFLKERLFADAVLPAIRSFFILEGIAQFL